MSNNFIIYNNKKFDQKEKDRIKKQKDCPHKMWITKCSTCNKILASDHHINIHTTHYNTNARIVFMYTDKFSYDQEIKRNIDSLSIDYDEIIVFTKNIQTQEILNDIKKIDKITIKTPIYEKKLIEKYRENEYNSITCFVSDTKSPNDFEKMCKRSQLPIIKNI